MQLTESQEALALYFFRVSQDPDLRNAGRDLGKFTRAFVARILLDIPAVFAYATGQVEGPVRTGLKRTGTAVLGTSMPPKLAAAVMETLDEEVIDRGFKWLGRALAGGRKEKHT